MRALLALAIGLFPTAFVWTPRTPAERAQTASALADRWSASARLDARKFLEEYGPPDRLEEGLIVWERRGDWERIEVSDITPYYDSSPAPPDLEETIVYAVSPDKREALAASGLKVRVSKSGLELSAFDSTEELNFLALNLADEIVRTGRDPAEAGRFYAMTRDLLVSGKSSPYAQSLLFRPGR